MAAQNPTIEDVCVSTACMTPMLLEDGDRLRFVLLGAELELKPFPILLGSSCLESLPKIIHGLIADVVRYLLGPLIVLQCFVVDVTTTQLLLVDLACLGLE